MEKWWTKKFFIASFFPFVNFVYRWAARRKKKDEEEKTRRKRSSEYGIKVRDWGRAWWHEVREVGGWVGKAKVAVIVGKGQEGAVVCNKCQCQHTIQNLITPTIIADLTDYWFYPKKKIFVYFYGFWV